MPHSPREARLLGLWTAGCLAVLLLIGVVRFGDPALQWPVFVVPLVWALVALRPRRGAVRDTAQEPGPEQQYPATREAPTLPRVPPEQSRRDW